MKWEEIDPFNKGKLIKKYIKAGFRSLDAMEKHWNDVTSKPASEEYIEESEPLELPDFKNQTYDADEGWRKIMRNTNKYADGGYLYKEGGEEEKTYAASINGTTDLESLANKYAIKAEKPWYADYQEVLPYKTLMEASKFKDKDKRKQYLDEQVYRRKTGESQYMQDLNKIAYGLDNLAIGSLATGVTAPVAYVAGTSVLPALAEPLSTAVNIGSKVLPSLSKVAPYAALGDAGIDLGLTIDGIRNAFTDNGIQKTVRLAKEGDAWSTLKSGVGDILDLFGTTKVLKGGYNFTRNMHYLRSKKWKEIEKDIKHKYIEFKKDYPEKVVSVEDYLTPKGVQIFRKSPSKINTRTLKGKRGMVGDIEFNIHAPLSLKTFMKAHGNLTLKEALHKPAFNVTDNISSDIYFNPLYLFRDSLRKPSSLPNKPSVTGVIAHEFDHSFQNLFLKPEYRLATQGKGYFIPNPNSVFYNLVKPFEKNSGTWWGSPWELQSEIARWKLEAGIPQSTKFVELDNKISEDILNKASKRFGLPKDEMSNTILGLSYEGYF